ncbi:acyl-CoA dehydrogenase [Orrella daihaiensis]|uniref:acyl-CoA dehydrogenase n=1 Tax=Orrella daihaiensis TaxID=2782176 RepID=UPI00350E8F37
MQYQPPTEDMAFVIRHVIDSQKISELPGYEEFSEDVIDAVLEEAGKFNAGMISPLNTVSDETGASLGDGHSVKTPTGFKEAYQQYIEAGWNGLACSPEYGGQGLPELLATATNEMLHSASMSFGLCPMLTAGAIHAIEHHGSDEQKQTYLPNLVSGQWAGTMNLTEPQAGSDLAAVTTKAVPNGDHYLISGIKIYITYGEHDLTENIIHLVLARLPDAPAGVKGISLFIVPKFLINDDGSLGARNDVKCISLEHKLGIHGSPTAVMSYGEAGGAIGYLVGKPNEGLAYMFTMMNHARLNVGLQGVAIAERALQQALWYAYDRVQGKTLIPGDQPNSAAPIAYHPDVRRMLASMQCRVQAMRALAYEAAAHMDIAAASEDAQVASAAQSRVDVLIPVVKGWCTEQSQDIASLGIQVHGGMGYVEESGAAQHLRDARITTIYEGTTAIQANDFIGRKILRDEGQGIGALINEVMDTGTTLGNSEDTALARLGQQLQQGAQTLRDCVDWVLKHGKEDAAAVYFGSVPMLLLAGDVLGGWMMARAALAASKPELINDPVAIKKRKAALVYGDLVLTCGLGRAHQVISAGTTIKQSLAL